MSNNIMEFEHIFTTWEAYPLYSLPLSPQSKITDGSPLREEDCAQAIQSPFPEHLRFLFIKTQCREFYQAFYTATKEFRRYEGNQIEMIQILY